MPRSRMLLCLVAALMILPHSAESRLGETRDQLIKRYGNPTDTEQRPEGSIGIRFHVAKLNCDIIVNVTNGVSIGEHYFSFTPLGRDNRPPPAAVRAFLDLNVSGATWHEVPTFADHQDAAMATEDGQFGAWISNNGSWFNKKCAFVVGVYNSAALRALSGASPTPTGTPVNVTTATATPQRSGPPPTPTPKREATSLEELLAPEKTAPQQPSAEGQHLWDNLLTALEHSDFEMALNLASQLKGTREIIEPYQQVFAEIVIDILSPNSNSSTGVQGPELDKQITQLYARLENERRKRAPILKRIADNRAGAQIAAFFTALAGDIARANITNAEQELAEVDRNCAALQAQITAAQNSVQAEKQQTAQALSVRTRQLRDRTILMLQQLRDAGEYRAVSALCNCYLRKIGTDEAIARTAQESIDQQKKQARALEIAKLALRPVNEAFGKGLFWKAKNELIKAVTLIYDRIGDQTQRKLVDKELAPTKREIDSKIAQALAEKDAILERGVRSHATAQSQLREFITSHPDYPSATQDEEKLANLQEEQLNDQLKRHIEAIETTLENDPEEAKAMVKKLEQTLNSDESSILKSKIMSIQSRIVKRELELIDSRIAEAQSYLARYNSTYAEDVKAGRHATFQLTSGVENLVRARSIQAGLVKQLEALSQENMPSVVHARLVGLLETERVALQTMDESLSAQRWVLGSIAFILTALAVGSFVLWRQKRGRSKIR